MPAGTDGTGYWTITVTALGYEDVTYQFQATEENIAKANPVTDTSELEAAIEKAKGLNKELYTAKSWSNVESELEEAETELERKHTQEMVDEAAEHLNNDCQPEISVCADEHSIFCVLQGRSEQ